MRLPHRRAPRAQPSPGSRPPLQRMLHLHQAIRAGGFPNATSLARELEVCTRSVRRDLDFMRDRLGLPVAYDRRRWGYYYTQAVSNFPTLQITEGELFALLVAEKAVQQYRGTNFEQPLLSALRKMAAALPDSISLHLADFDQAISFRTSAEPLLNLRIFDQLARATAQRQQLELAYRKPRQTTPERRVVDPYHLANINGEWYLFAFDHLRGDIRTFVPARIRAVRPTGKTFQRPSGFSMDERLRGSFGVHSGEGRFEVIVRFSAAVADYIREKRWHPSQKLRERSDGGVEVQLKLTSLGEVERWILGWGGHARVIQPPELLERVQAAAREILGHH